MFTQCARVCRVVALVALVAAGREATGQPEAAPEARQVLDRVRAHFGGAKGVRVVATMSTVMKAQGEDVTNEQRIEIVAARPNLVSLRPVGDEAGQYAFACDGRVLTQYFGGPFNKYESREAPAGMGELIDAASFGQPPDSFTLWMSPHIVVLALVDGERFEEALEGVQRIEHAGREEIDGRSCDRIRLVGESGDAEVWVRAGDAPWIERIAPDMSKMFEAMGERAGALEEMMPRTTLSFADWASFESPPEGAFAFTPPEGAEKVESLMQAMQEFAGQGVGGEEGHADLLGKPAPELDLDLLGGGKASLGPHRGKEVVVLDFWATWCPPCVRGLPIVSGVAAAFKDKGVVFYAVNEQEEEATIREFLEQKGLEIRVALDREGKAGSAYGVSGIPQTVLIGRDGTVQAVHVGFMPSMEDELKEQLEALVNNKTLVDPAGDPKEEPVAAGGGAGDDAALELAWSRDGSWHGVAVDPATGETFAVQWGGAVSRLDRDGNAVGTFRLPADQESRGALRLAQLAGDARPELVTFGHWGPAVSAYDSQGTVLWQYRVGHGVDDVWAADLDAPGGDGRDEVIIGYNGGTGLHVLEADGTPRWKYTGIGNVWHVTAGPTGPNGAMEVITTSAAGQIHVFDREGKRIRDLNGGGYANLVRVACPAPGAEPVIITSLSDRSAIAAISRSGTRLWRAPVESDGHLNAVDGQGAPGGPWFAVAVADGSVQVFDLAGGSRIASVRAGAMPAVAWVGADGDRPALLVTASTSGLRAFRMPRAAPDGDDEPGP